MMMVICKYTRIFLLCLSVLAGGLTVVSCTDDGEEFDVGQIAFNTQMSGEGDAATRATVLSYSRLQSDGFGVFAYYMKDKSWDEFVIPSRPNFINNTQVTSSDNGVSWDYSPKRYWPNNKADKLSFFAYAPYMSSLVLNGTKIEYTTSADVTEQVDLCWSNSDTRNLNKTSVGSGAVEFKFKHALSRIGFTVRAKAEGASPLPEGMTIKIKKVVLTSPDDMTGSGSGVFYTSGILDLMNYSDKPVWSGTDGNGFFTLLPENFVGKAPDGFVLDKDNTADAVVLNADDSYVMVIPKDLSASGFNVYMEYDLILKKGYEYFTYTNKGTGNIKVDLEPGMAYTIEIQFNSEKIELLDPEIKLISILEWTSGGSVYIPGLVS